ncbi:MAG: hypothetical protein QY328_02390 [Anaerolineales bacterium]|nr:MAG: hypothetical protein QY328_02390 [Anaerolineales bacterium]
MSIYDQRDKPAYELFKIEPEYAKNPHILKWWDSTLDELLPTRISQWQWVWYGGIVDEIIEIVPSSTIDDWKKSDPLCSKYAWYNILMNFAVARAEQLGFTKFIRKPQKKVCPLCNCEFVEDSLPAPLIQRLGINNLDFCAPCLKDSILQGTGNNTTSKKKISEYLQNLSALLGRVPHQNFGEGIGDLIDFSYEDRLALIRLLQGKPSIKSVKSVFGSWLNALIQAGVLDDGTRKSGRGIQTIAKDGHICLSLGEKTIDEYLYSHGIFHEKEPRYPEGNFRADFKVGETFIEYFGLMGSPDYDMKTKEKILLCKKHNIALIAIYPEDLVSLKKLEDKLSILIKKQ